MFTATETFGQMNSDIVWVNTSVQATMMECPDVFPLGDSGKWMLIGSLYSTNQWWLGTVEGSPPRFTALNVGIMDYGNGYAAKTGSTFAASPTDRRVVFGFTGWSEPTVVSRDDVAAGSVASVFLYAARAGLGLPARPHHPTGHHARRGWRLAPYSAHPRAANPAATRVTHQARGLISCDIIWARGEHTCAQRLFPGFNHEGFNARFWGSCVGVNSVHILSGGCPHE